MTGAAVGAELDAGPVSMAGNLRAIIDGQGRAVGTLRDVSDKLAAILREQQLDRGHARKLKGTNAADANGFLAIDLGAPSLSNMWYVRRLNVCDPSAIMTSPAGNLVVIVSSNAGLTFSTAGADATGVVFTSATMLQNLTFSNMVVPVFPGEHLWVLASGVTAAKVIAANAACEEVLMSVPDLMPLPR